ncbi:hypothetical protein NQZ68_016225 [Dissostichus eleginoides]|nr:hypothetical protein NQZ68_016225 [Dissostichus eleginoides]
MRPLPEVPGVQASACCQHGIKTEQKNLQGPDRMLSVDPLCPPKLILKSRLACPFRVGFALNQALKEASSSAVPQRRPQQCVQYHFIAHCVTLVPFGKDRKRPPEAFGKYGPFTAYRHERDPAEHPDTMNADEDGRAAESEREERRVARDMSTVNKGNYGWWNDDDRAISSGHAGYYLTAFWCSEGNPRDARGSKENEQRGIFLYLSSEWARLSVNPYVLLLRQGEEQQGDKTVLMRARSDLESDRRQSITMPLQSCSLASETTRRLRQEMRDMLRAKESSLSLPAPDPFIIAQELGTSQLEHW